MADREAIQAQLAALKGAFLAQLGTRLDELESAWAAGNLAEVHRHAHKLAGTAGTFGVAEISALARNLEHQLAQAREGQPITDSQRDEAHKLLVKLRETAAN